jgi:hypothetical protein
VQDANNRFTSAPLDAEGVNTSVVIPGLRLTMAWLWQNQLPNVERILPGLLADAPGLPDELRALYRQMAQLLGG